MTSPLTGKITALRMASRESESARGGGGRGGDDGFTMCVSVAVETTGWQPAQQCWHRGELVNKLQCSAQTRAAQAHPWGGEWRRQQSGAAGGEITDLQHSSAAIWWHLGMQPARTGGRPGGRWAPDVPGGGGKGEGRGVSTAANPAPPSTCRPRTCVCIRGDRQARVCPWVRHPHGRKQRSYRQDKWVGGDGECTPPGSQPQEKKLKISPTPRCCTRGRLTDLP